MFRQSFLTTSTIGDLTISPLLLDVFEDRRLRHLRADDQTDDDEDDAREERHPPRPVTAEVDADEEHKVGDEQTDREARLDDAGVAALLLPRCVLVAHQDGAAPLGAERQALNDANGHQQDRCQHADGRVGRQQADRERGQAHEDQRRDQDRLAADLVTEVAADDATERPGDEPDAERRERQQGARQRAGVREERRAEVQRGGSAEPDEVVGLDDGADTGADRYPFGVLGAVHRTPHLESVVAHDGHPSNTRSSWAIKVTVTVNSALRDPV